jgi:phosphoribosylamine--glycine ligase
MAGHSKWANIQHRKGRQDEKRGKVWTRVIREIMVAARQGGGDLGINPRLRLAVEKAKAANMPADTIKRNIDKATGNLEGVNYEEIRYEGYGIGGAAIIVDTMTDNRVRTVAEVRHAFSKYGGNMGTEGSVAFQFKHVGQLILAPGTSEDKVMDVALEAGAEDVVSDEDGAIEVLTSPADFEKVRNALEAAGLKPEVAEVTMRPENTIELAGDDAARMQKLLDVLEDLDDVQDVFHNASRNEGPRHRRRRPRTRAGLEAGAVAQGAGGLRRARQRRHGARCPAGERADHRRGAAARMGAGTEDRADGGRPRGAAGGRRGRRVPRPRDAHLRAHPGGGAAGKLQGLLQGLHAPARHPDGGVRDVHGPADAHAYIDRMGAPIVVKADGLAAGKGVVVAMTTDEAHEAVDFMLLDNKLGVSHNAGGARVVIEEFLQGEEASFIVLCDGKNVTALATSQDHKRLLDGDQGPNTGGMGAYSPAPVVTPAVHARAMREVILPTMRGMEKDGIPYTGFLYAGLMIDPQGGIKTLEFNCRMGDPETQPILMRLKSDLFDVMLAATAGTLDQVELQWDRRTALGVVMAAAGYPLSPRKGDAITGLPRDAGDAMVFHAATAAQDGKLVTTGGRVLCVTALAEGVKAAQQRAYEVVEGIRFDGAQFRRDIGHRAVKA